MFWQGLVTKARSQFVSRLTFLFFVHYKELGSFNSLLIIDFLKEPFVISILPQWTMVLVCAPLSGSRKFLE